MPNEVGGRADKFGNRYESRWVVKQFLRLLKEEIASVIIEPIGEEEEGVDLWVNNKDGSRECHQCKTRNASKEFWALSDLASRGIFRKAKKQLDLGNDVTYFFISAAAGLMLNDLSARARNSNSNSEDFHQFQIVKAGSEVKKAFVNFSKYMELNIDTIQGRNQAYDYLRRMYIIQYADDLYAKNSLIDEIKFLFAGNAEAIYSLLSSYAIENDLLGREITAYMLYNYLDKQPGIAHRQLYKDERIIPRLDYLNTEFFSSFVPINNSFIHRIESKSCYNKIISGDSIIIHGKAGSGKSGCVFELLEHLKEDNIIHLALKLDRRIPEHTSEKYGQSLGLPTSPVYCLDAVSKCREAVLVLDQLDAVRWTNNHSRTALEVCREMIREVECVNKYRDKKLILVFVCRTFDFKNDPGIKGLFLKTEDKNEDGTWNEIIIGEMDDESVKAIVGVAYQNFSKKLQALLRTPSNLYIWTNIEEKRRINTYSTSSELVKQWWEQLLYNYEITNNSSSQLIELKDKIINNIDRTGKLMIPIQLLGSYSMLGKEYLLSNGLLLLNGNNLGFVHQSIYDYFSMEKMLTRIFEGDSIINIIGPRIKQTPMKRYHLQMLFENLMDYDMDKFINIGSGLMHNEEVRFYMKYVFLEVLGQAESISQNAKVFLNEFLSNKYWKNHFVDAVLMNHPIFIRFLIQEEYIRTWLKSEHDRDTGIILLRSVNTAMPDEITSLLYPFAFHDNEMDAKIYGTICWNIEDDSDNMFEFRLKILKRQSQFWNNYIQWDEILNKKPERAIRLLDVLVKNNANMEKFDMHDLDQKAVDKFIDAVKIRPLHIWDTFMPYLAGSTLNIESIYDKGLKFWNTEQYMDHIYGRTYVKMIKASTQALIQKSPKEFLPLCEPYYNNSSLIVNEILLYIMEALSEECSDYVINWLIEKPYHHFFNYTGENDEYLYSSKMVIEKHSKTCSDEVFRKLENAIYYFHEEDELWMAKRRFEFNNENRKEGSKILVYWPYWGEVQHYLITALDSQRVSQKTKELAIILERRFDEWDMSHKRSKVTGGFVGSTIGTIANKISDKQWLRIIGNKKTYKHWNEKWPRGEGDILESSPQQFARDFERIGEKEPSRIANLALNFSGEVDNHYISAVYHVIEKKEASKGVESENWEPVSMNMAQQLFLKFGGRDDINVATSFSRAIRNRADENWNDEVMDIVSSIAKNHANPEKGKMNVTSSEDKEGKTVNMLHSNSMNCVRGCAAGAVAALLWEDKERYGKLKKTVESVVYDKHLAVNMAAIECICPVMNFDKGAATKWFFDLARKDIRIVAHPFAYNLFYHLFQDKEKLIKETVLLMYQSDYEDVSEIGARHVANMNLLYGCFEEFIFSDIPKTKAQKQGILKVAINLLGNFTFHDKSKIIIEQFLDDEEDLSNLYIQILYKKSVNVEEDLEFIVKIVTAKTNRLMMHRFVDFIDESDPPIEGFKDIIFEMCQNIIRNTRREANDIRSELFGIAPELSRLIASLYDRTQDNFEANQQCLDMWDLMFENRIGTVRELSQSIMDC